LEANVKKCRLRFPKKELEEIEPELDEDISPFRRIVLEIIDLRRKPSNLDSLGIKIIEDVLSNFNLLDRVFEFVTEEFASMEQRKARQKLKKAKDELHYEKLTFEITAKRFLVKTISGPCEDILF
jgi:hypothetical protein